MGGNVLRLQIMVHWNVCSIILFIKKDYS